jgi:hypothetical protein
MPSGRQRTLWISLQKDDFGKDGLCLNSEIVQLKLTNSGLKTSVVSAAVALVSTVCSGHRFENVPSQMKVKVTVDSFCVLIVSESLCQQANE